MLPRCVGALMIAVLLLLARAGFSQAPAGAPDVVIFIAPQDPQGSQIQVALTYSKIVPHAPVREQLNRLAAASGWKISSLNIEDVQDLKQTGATVVLLNAPQVRDGGFWLQPYAEAFQKLNRIELFYLWPPDPAFRGLRSFDDPSLTVRLIRAGNPYRYLIDIREHTGKLPQLPITQAPEQSSPTASGNHGQGSLAGSVAPVLVVAALAGLVVFTLLYLRARRLASPRPQNPPRP